MLGIWPVSPSGIRLLVRRVDRIPYYDLNGVVARAGVSRQTLWQWRARGVIPAGHNYRNR